MKKWITLTLALCMLLALVPAAATKAQAADSDNLFDTSFETEDQFALALDDVSVTNVPPETISSVSVYVGAPELDMPVSDMVYYPADSGFYVANAFWEPYGDDTFEAGKEYSVCITIEAEEGYMFHPLVKPAINDQESMILSRSEDQIKFSLTFEPLKVQRPSMFFDDVSVDNWFNSDVEFVYYNGLMYGTDTNLFSPHLSTTRGMIVTVLYRFEGEPVLSGDCPFTDVRPGSYYDDPITWASENGIVLGIGNNQFAPEKNVTREELATILFRYAKYKGVYDEDDCVMLGGFSDLDQIADWAYEPLSWAVGCDLINGSNEADGLYMLPAANAERCQVAAILHRLYNYLLK